MSEREIEYISVAGRDIPAYLAVCPKCKTLDLGTMFAPGDDLKSLVATCPNGHEWDIPAEKFA